MYNIKYLSWQVESSECNDSASFVTNWFRHLANLDAIRGKTSAENEKQNVEKNRSPVAFLADFGVRWGRGLAGRSRPRRGLLPSGGVRHQTRIFRRVTVTHWSRYDNRKTTQSKPSASAALSRQKARCK